MQKIIKLPIKGTFYYSAEIAMQAGLLSKNTVITLNPEPENAFDGYAVQIWLPISADKNNSQIDSKSELKTELNEHGLLLGYIPKMLSKRIYNLFSNHFISDVHIIHAAQQGKRIEIDCQIIIDQAWLPYLKLLIQSQVVSKLYLLKRTKERWFGHNSSKQ